MALAGWLVLWSSCQDCLPPEARRASVFLVVVNVWLQEGKVHGAGEKCWWQAGCAVLSQVACCRPVLLSHGPGFQLRPTCLACMGSAALYSLSLSRSGAFVPGQGVSGL